MPEQDENSLKNICDAITRLKIRGWTQKKIAEDTGVHPSVLSRLVSGRRISLSGKNWSALDAFLKKFEDGEIPPATEEPVQEKSPNSFFSVPVRSASGGMGGGCENGSRSIVSHIPMRRDFLARFGSPLRSLSFVHTWGDSMEPTIPEKSLVLIDESDIFPTNGKIYYILLGSRYLIKRLEVSPAGRITAIISDNGGHRRELAEQERCEVIGRALMLVRDL